MNQPKGFIANEQEKKVCKLVKSYMDLNKHPINDIKNSTNSLYLINSLSMNMISTYIRK